MRFLRTLSASGFLIGAGAAHADITATVTVVTDYNFRGISQSAHDPTPQPSLDWASGTGWYAGVWGSKVELGGNLPNIEVDLYGGFKQALDSGLGYDLGSVYYNYHAPGGRKYDYIEVYAGASYGWGSAKLYFSPKFGGDAASEMLGGDGLSAFYLTADAAYPLPSRFSLIAHAGYSFGEYWNTAKDHGLSRPYLDWYAGISRMYGHFNLALKWVDGSDLKEADPTPLDILSTQPRAVFSVSTTFPWTSASRL